MEVSSLLHAPRPSLLTLGKGPPVPIKWVAGWTSEPVWTRWRREKLPSSVGNRNLVVQHVAQSIYRQSYRGSNTIGLWLSVWGIGADVVTK